MIQPTYHLDKRAAALGAAGAGAPDDLLSTKQLAEWLGVSRQWAEINRSKGLGPPWVRISPTRIRYRRADVLCWLAERTYNATGEYVARRPPGGSMPGQGSTAAHEQHPPPDEGAAG